MVDILESILAKLSSKDIEAISKSTAPKSGMGIPVVSPYHRPSPSTVNLAEFIALRTIVMALIVEGAAKYETSGAGPAQDWINNISVRCQESLLAAKISAENAETLRREAMEHVNLILGGVRSAR